MVDGNKRLALAALIAFCGVNDHRVTMSNDEAYDLIIALATGERTDIPAIAERLARGTATPRRNERDLASER